MPDQLQEHKKRVSRILNNGKRQSNLDLIVSQKNIQKYISYLKKSVECPCLLTGEEGFPWEDCYILGRNYKRRQVLPNKNYPSSKDVYKLIKFEEVTENQAFVTVMREYDKRKFSIALDWLEAVYPQIPNYQLLHDYMVWFINY